MCLYLYLYYQTTGKAGCMCPYRWRCSYTTSWWSRMYMRFPSMCCNTSYSTRNMGGPTMCTTSSGDLSNSLEKSCAVVVERLKGFIILDLLVHGEKDGQGGPKKVSCSANLRDALCVVFVVVLWVEGLSWTLLAPSGCGCGWGSVYFSWACSYVACLGVGKVMVCYCFCLIWQ